MPKLLPYQEVGVRFLADRPRAYLADKMGMGKSAQAIRGAVEVGVRKPVVVCPAIAVPNWRREWEKWDGPHPDKLKVLSYNAAVNYGIPSGDLVIVDEAHYCKTPSALRTKRVLAAAARTERSWLLSGTPMPNHPGELWPPIKYLWPELTSCKTAEQWQSEYCKVRRTAWGMKPYGVRNGSELRELLSKILLRREPEPGMLPPLRIHLSYLNRRSLPPVSMEEMSQTEYEASARRILGVAKAPLISNVVVEELKDKQYDQVVVVYYHKDVAQIFEEQFRAAGVTFCRVGGDTPSTARQRHIDAFQARDVQVFLGQQTTMGVAINLTAAAEIVIAEPDWVPDVNAQTIKRIHRIGQDKPCRARIFAVAETIDEDIMDTIFRKVEMQTEVGL